jgi:hypothetical protein
LRQLLDTSDHAATKFNEVKLSKEVFKLDTAHADILKASKKLEEFGIDSFETFHSILEHASSIDILYSSAKKLDADKSEAFLNTVARYLLYKKGDQEGELQKWIGNRIKEFLEVEEPTKGQIYFVQSYFTKVILNVVKSKDENEEAMKNIGEILDSYKDVKHTKLSSNIVQMLVLTLFLIDSKKSEHVTQSAIKLLLDAKDLPKALKHDLFCLVGRKVFEQVNAKIDDDQETDKASNLIMQSDLLSGGL